MGLHRRVRLSRARGPDAEPVHLPPLLPASGCGASRDDRRSDACGVPALSGVSRERPRTREVSRERSDAADHETPAFGELEFAALDLSPAVAAVLREQRDQEVSLQRLRARRHHAAPHRPLPRGPRVGPLLTGVLRGLPDAGRGGDDGKRPRVPDTRGHRVAGEPGRPIAAARPELAGRREQASLDE